MSKPTLPVVTEDFWLGRIFDTVIRGRELHTIIYDIDPVTWTEIQNTSAGILQRFLKPGMKVLDAGCGYGALYEAMIQYPVLLEVEYTGIDLSPHLTRIGNLKFPDVTFLVRDLRDTQFEDDHFDYVICRSIRDMLLQNDQGKVWDEVFTELKRISSNVVIMEYDNLLGYQVHQKR